MPDLSYSALPEHVTMPLLERVTQQSLDQDYIHVARRRAAVGDHRPTRRSPWWAVAGVLTMFGLLVSTAAVQRSRNAEVDETSRSALVEQVTERRVTLAAAQAELAQLQSENLGLEQRLVNLATEQNQVSADLSALQSKTGFAPASGAGIRVVVDDSPSGISREVVRDTDLALLVDALWGVGADAVAINGQRLTVLSSIRNVNVAIHVNGQPLAPPYIVEAIGNPRTLQADLVNSTRGRTFFDLADALSLDWEMSNQPELTLPGARQPELRSVGKPEVVDNGLGRTGEGVSP
jgi:uncharacterized protein YlxW (UPF0749 family)